SAGQRCSALRCLYVQEDIAEDLTRMLIGAMEALQLGDPWNLSTDVGPVIDAAAQEGIKAHIEAARAEGRLIAEVATPAQGTFIAPTLIKVSGIGALEREIFGPVLHLATFRARDLDRVIDDINATGYGLTFGLQTRIDDRVQHVSERIAAGNIYVNRNQIGAIVGSQPFGGEGLSGTGPKAGGPNYLTRFAEADLREVSDDWGSATASPPALPDLPHRVIETLSMPGPTGESNRLSTLPRPALLCMGPGEETAAAQARAVEALGGVALQADGMIPPDALGAAPLYGGVLWWGDEATARTIETTLAERQGPIVPLIRGLPDSARVRAERHVCVDTTASGGNAELLGAMA
ncbi:MAG: aldehyde dehydrogenase family protein, partial [Sulfitobacter sp.]|nr:aldehyde dehydrogenase family protein [Sulfitobacter sp.]